MTKQRRHSFKVFEGTWNEKHLKKSLLLTVEKQVLDLTLSLDCI